MDFLLLGARNGKKTGQKLSTAQNVVVEKVKYIFVARGLKDVFLGFIKVYDYSFSLNLLPQLKEKELVKIKIQKGITKIIDNRKTEAIAAQFAAKKQILHKQENAQNVYNQYMSLLNNQPELQTMFYQNIKNEEERIKQKMNINYNKFR